MEKRSTEIFQGHFFLIIYPVMIEVNFNKILFSFFEHVHHIDKTNISEHLVWSFAVVFYNPYVLGVQLLSM